MLKNNTPLAKILRKIGNEKCLKKAAELEQSSTPISTLHLRSLDLNEATVIAIASALQQESAFNQHQLTSISFSYNVALGNAGAIALAQHLPKSVREVGLVGCGIGDAGGIAVLKWMKDAPHLRMICIEQNDFSAQVRSAFQQFSSDHPQVMVVF